MKNIIVVVGGALGSFLVLLLLGVGLLYMKPELFVHGDPTLAAAADSVKPKSDTLKIRRPDSLEVVAVAKPQERPGQTKQDTLLVTATTEKPRSPGTSVDSLKKIPQVAKVKSDSSSQSDWKTTAKLIETMNPEEAGKILRLMSDNEVKQVITKVKRKQAGKILANLEPERAARILR
jgi:flagellar motility protein MotE (MotC chaperone)